MNKRTFMQTCALLLASGLYATKDVPPKAAPNELRTKEETISWFKDVTNFEKVSIPVKVFGLPSHAWVPPNASGTTWKGLKGDGNVPLYVYSPHPVSLPVSEFEHCGIPSDASPINFPTAYHAIQYHRFCKASNIYSDCKDQPNHAKCFLDKVLGKTVNEIVLLSEQLSAATSEDKIKELTTRSLAKILHAKYYTADGDPTDALKAVNSILKPVVGNEKILIQYGNRDDFHFSGDMTFSGWWNRIYSGKNIYGKVLNFVLHQNRDFEEKIKEMADIQVTKTIGKARPSARILANADELKHWAENMDPSETVEFDFETFKANNGVHWDREKFEDADPIIPFTYMIPRVNKHSSKYGKVVLPNKVFESPYKAMQYPDADLETILRAKYFYSGNDADLQFDFERFNGKILVETTEAYERNRFGTMVKYGNALVGKNPVGLTLMRIAKDPSPLNSYTRNPDVVINSKNARVLSDWSQLLLRVGRMHIDDEDLGFLAGKGEGELQTFATAVEIFNEMQIADKDQYSADKSVATWNTFVKSQTDALKEALEYFYTFLMLDGRITSKVSDISGFAKIDCNKELEKLEKIYKNSMTNAGDNGPALQEQFATSLTHLLRLHGLQAVLDDLPSSSSDGQKQLKGLHIETVNLYNAAVGAIDQAGRPRTDSSPRQTTSSSSDEDSDGIFNHGGGSSGGKSSSYSGSKSSGSDDDVAAPAAPSKAEESEPTAAPAAPATPGAASSIFGSTAMLALVGALFYIL